MGVPVGWRGVRGVAWGGLTPPVPQVPTVRIECEMVAADLADRVVKAELERGHSQSEAEAAARERVALVRINPDFPECPALAAKPATVVSLRMGGRAALEAIDRAMGK